MAFAALQGDRALSDPDMSCTQRCAQFSSAQFSSALVSAGSIRPMCCADHCPVQAWIGYPGTTVLRLHTVHLLYLPVCATVCQVSQYMPMPSSLLCHGTQR